MKPKYRIDPPREIAEALSVYREHCKFFPFANRSFSGCADDLDNLGYCEYETGFPDSDYSKASLVWANVMVIAGCAHWGRTVEDEVVLLAPDCDESWSRWIFYPQPLFRLVLSNEYIQFQSIEIVTQLFMLHALSAGSGLSELKPLIKIIRHLRKDDEGSIFEGVASMSRVLDRLSKPEAEGEVRSE
ncbi:MAG: hypothetical protein QM496_21770 [Verrucomicrobiota bacterium]